VGAASHVLQSHFVAGRSVALGMIHMKLVERPARK
jgi:hypothetical protein